MPLKARYFVTAALGLAFALAVPSAFAEEAAQGKRRGSGKLMERFDENKDGQLSQSEVPEKLWERLSKVDANSDGTVSAEELAAGRQKAKGEGGRNHKIGRFDKDGDGKISKEEAGEKLAERFDAIDKDGDGFLTRDELKEAAKARFASKDTNGDGKISQEEFGGKEEMFSRLDKNSDGFLTTDELRGRRHKHAGKRGEGEGDSGAKPIRRGRRGESTEE